MDNILSKIRDANPDRKSKNLDRRLLKLGEEYGEVCQAFVAVTSKNNSKKKTWDDVREELCDVIIVALDMLLTEMPEEDFDKIKYRGMTKDQKIEHRSLAEIDRKLGKWLNKTSNLQIDTDDAE